MAEKHGDPPQNSKKPPVRRKKNEIGCSNSALGGRENGNKHRRTITSSKEGDVSIKGVQ